jgi:MFS superfamily sulfate permease-like transporter
MKRRSSVQHNYSVMNKLLLQTFTQVLDLLSNILAIWHVTKKLSKLLLIANLAAHSYFCNSRTRQRWYRKLICIVVFCIMTIHNLANGYQELGGTSSSFPWNTGMYLPNYMASHHQVHNKTMNKVDKSASSGGAYTVCMYIYKHI